MVIQKAIFGRVPLLHDPSPNLFTQVGAIALRRRRQRDLSPPTKSRFVQFFEPHLFRASHGPWMPELDGPRGHIAPRPTIYANAETFPDL
jgi:hypothetical protein